MAKVRASRVVIEVPEVLRLPPDELEERLGIELSLRLYEKSIASLGQARSITRLSKWSFLEMLLKKECYYTMRGGLERSYKPLEGLAVIGSSSQTIYLLQTIKNMITNEIWNEGVKVGNIVLSSLWVQGNNSEDNDWDPLNVMNGILDNETTRKNKDYTLNTETLLE